MQYSGLYCHIPKLVIIFCVFNSFKSITKYKYFYFIIRLATEETINLGALSKTYLGIIRPTEPPTVVMKSRLILPHPDFKFEDVAGTLPADLALIQIPDPIKFNSYIFFLILHQFSTIQTFFYLI